MLNNLFTTVQESLKGHDTAHDLEWLDTLSGMTELESLIAVKDQIAKIDINKPRALKKNIDQVLDFDQGSYKKAKKIAHNYLIKFRNDKDVKRDVYVVAYEYHRQLYMAYSQIIDTFQASTKLKLSAEKVTLLLARYLNAVFMMSKWRYFDDQPVTHGVWNNVHKVIKIAENLAIMNKSLFLYQFQIKETSIAAILKRGFMVDTMQKGNYSQLEIELADRVLKIWSTNPLIVNTYKKDRYHFFIALEGDRGPERLRLREKFTACCYWKTTRLVDLMEAYLCAIDMQKSVREFGLGKVAPESVVIKLFKKLRVDWCVEGYSRQRRSEKRKQKSSLLHISYGINAIHACLKVQQEKQELEQVASHGFTFDLNETAHGDEAVSIDATNVPDSETRWMVDESKSGFAIDYGRNVPSWVETGVLVGYLETGYKKTFNIAEIRSVRKLANGTYRAGFKKISHNATALKVATVENTSVLEPVEGYFLDDGKSKISYSTAFAGLLIDNDAIHTPKLLLPRKKFKSGGTYKIGSDEDNHEVGAGKLLAKHNDWVLFEALLGDE